MKISIFGTGYVGLVTGVCLAELGHQIVCVDTIPEKIEGLKKGLSPIYEPGLSELILKNKSNLTFTTIAKNAIKDSEIIFIAVGTPQSKDGSADLKYIKQVAKTISQSINGYKVIIIKSTVPVGTGDMVEDIISQKYPGNFAVVSNPEFLKEGSAINDFFMPDRIIIGTNDRTAKKLIQKMYSKLNSPYIFTDRHSSELIKYASNAFLATKISFINSMARLAEKLDANIKDISVGMGLDKRIGPHFLNAGIGYGGSCFPKDVQALIYSAKVNGLNLEILEAAEKINVKQKSLAVEKLAQTINLKGATIGLLGLSFKPNTDDLREAPSLTIIKELLEKGAHVRAWDPVSEPLCHNLFPEVHYCPTPYEPIENADAMIVVTEWPRLKSFNLKKAKSLMKQPLIIDGRNIFDKKKAQKAGFKYYGIGV